jgi:alpha-D-xyloside xylohydrolase
VTCNVFDRNTEVATGQSIDGARATATAYTAVFDRTAFEAKLEFVFQDDEALFGLGSHEEGFGNLRGHARELYQQNMKAVVPHLVSTRGYSVLLDCCSLMTFHDDALGSYWWADCVDELDYYIITGPTYRDVLLGYRDLTGKPPLPPKWAFGYTQSKERYVTADEMLDVVREYRRRKVPLDVIVLDWKSWPNGSGWGQKTLDPVRFPDPAAFTQALHDMGARLMVSVWPIMTGGCPDQRAFLDRDLMLGNRSTYNAFLPEARTLYWEQAERGLFQFGVDAWWCDCTEPFEADWTGAVKPESHARLALNTAESKLYLDDGEINAYSLAHAQGLYDGQRRVSSAKRVLNLTRSSYAGQSRFGTVTWNGDICATWQTLRRSVAEGLNFCATGEPYWTVDIGGFFVDHNPKLWFWRGDYPEGTRGLTDMDALAPDPNDAGSRDLGFWELYTRWLQYAAFLPMFRSHGTDVSREIWRFGEEGTPFYDAIACSIRLRYRLLPFLYSLAAEISFGGGSFLCALALEFPGDLACSSISDQFLLGSSLMVCPITSPTFYGPGSEPLTGVPHCRPVYLPLCAGWYDFWTGTYITAGQSLLAPSPLDRNPIYARAGSIVVLGQVMQFVDEIPDAPFDVHVYSGCDADFVLYEDAGDGYDYEQGAFARVALSWREREQTLTLSVREGRFPTLVQERTFRITCYTPRGQQRQEVVYNGVEQHLQFEISKESA